MRVAHRRGTIAEVGQLQATRGQLRAVGESVSLAFQDLQRDDSITLEDTWAPCLLEAREDFGEWRGGGCACVACACSSRSREVGGAGSPECLRGLSGRAGPGLAVPHGPSGVGRGVTDPR